MLPPLTIERIGRVDVVRDDRVPGGTKQRALVRLLAHDTEYVYASPAYGYAQMALAYAASAIGAAATIFTAKRDTIHPRTAQAKAAGAKIVLIPYGYLSNVQAKARAYAAATGATLLPFGLNTPAFIAALAAVAADVPSTPAEVWTVAGSGVLTRALQQAWPSATFHAIQIGKPPDVGRARLYIAPERYEDVAQQPPPFPSCSNYDAKAWRFIQQHASDGALFWNVGA